MEFVYFHKQKYSKFIFTYFYTENGLVFTTFNNDPLREFGRFFPDNKSILHHQQDKTFTNISKEYFSGKNFSPEVQIDWKYIKNQKLIKVMRAIKEVKILTSYQKLSNSLGEEKAVRSIATYVGKNPIEVFIPCHRIIQKTGKIGNYRDGIKIKEKLIELEKQIG
jgi:O-6-methylguanine DNA methyltransferase